MKRTRKSGKPVSADSIARQAEQGKDVSHFFKGQGRMVQPIQRVNVDVTAAMLEQPSSMRDTKLLVGYAERLVELDHRKTASYLLVLSRAYSLDGQAVRAKLSATEGLALTPEMKAGNRITATRKWLLAQADL